MDKCKVRITDEMDHDTTPIKLIGQVSYGGVQLRGPNPYPILGKAGPRKHTLF